MQLSTSRSQSQIWNNRRILVFEVCKDVCEDVCQDVCEDVCENVDVIWEMIYGWEDLCLTVRCVGETWRTDSRYTNMKQKEHRG